MSKPPPKPNPSNLSLLEQSLSPRDLSIIETLAQEIKELKSKISPIEDSIKEDLKSKKTYTDKLKKILLKYEGLTGNFEISGIPISYVKGSTYLDERLLMEEGVPKDLLDKCRRSRPGYYVIDRKTREGKEGKEDE